MKTGHEQLAFVKEALRNFLKTGTIVPSSKFLSDRICEKALEYSPVPEPCIVEVGAGTGKITIPLLSAFPNSQFWIFEPNRTFFNALIKKVRKDFPDRNSSVFVVNECVEESKNVPSKCDIIVSSLPLLSFKKQQRNKVLYSFKKMLTTNGIMIQYGYTPLTEMFLRKYFSVIDRSVVPLNLPPAIVYVCKVKLNG